MVTAKEVPPGGAGEIKAIFKSKGYNGSVTKTFTVASNDPKNSTVRLKLTGKVVTDVNVEPRYINFGTVNKNQISESRALKITFREGRKIKIKDVRSESQAVVLKKEKEDQNGAVYSVTLAENLPIGRHVGTIEIKTDSDTSPLVKISFYSVVQGSARVAPQALYLGIIQPGTPTTRTLTVTKTTEKAFTVKNIKSSSPQITTELVTEKAGDLYKVRVTYDPGEKTTGRIVERLTIYVEADEEEALDVGVNGNIRQRKKTHNQPK